MTTTNVFDPVARPDLATIHDRRPLRPNNERVLFGEGTFAQAADINEGFSIEADKRKAVANLIARDGDRLEGGDIQVNTGAGTVFISAGKLFIDGSPRDIPARTLTGVPMAGLVQLGVRLTQGVVTAADDPIYLGLEPTAEESYGEPGGVRVVNTYAWAFATDGGAGQFYPYVTLLDGVIVSQDAPPTLSGVQQQIRLYDYDAHENYVVRGCTVMALGLTGGKQVFSIAEGTANILGAKIQRPTASRYEQTEQPDLGTVASEPTTYVDAGGSAVLKVRRPPIAAISSVVITKQKTVTLTKGVAGSVDALPDSSTTEILSVVQGGTTYAVTTSYLKNGDAIDWSPVGPEPASNSTYQVTYQYLAAVVPSAFTATTVTVSGGVDGKPAFINYTNKLPRTDAICINDKGEIVYLKGISAVQNPQPPVIPGSLLMLAIVKNNWYGTAVVDDSATIRSYPFSQIHRMYNNMIDLFNQVSLQKQAISINSRAPAARTGIFSDPLIDDSFRDAGAVQNGAVFDGSFQIPIVPSFVKITASGVLTLFASEVNGIVQDAVSGCEKINPYQSFTPPPARMTISPAEDFWTDRRTDWLSAQTSVFGRGNAERTTSTTVQKVSTTNESFLRQTSISFTIRDLGNGEALSKLTFDGIDVTPAGLVANAAGVLTGSFNIPANVSSGTKLVQATMASGTIASAMFTGQGKLEITTRQTINVIQRFNVNTARNSDPQAQSFVLVSGRHVSSIDLRFCAIGNRNNPVIVEIVEMDNGFPTRQVLAQAEVDMNTVVTNSWTRFTFPVPVYLPQDRMYAFVVLTNDANHAISVATRGEFDQIAQKWIAAQPYTVGTRFSSSNAISWTVHQDSDITCRVNFAKFDPATRVVDLGTFAVNNCSDAIVRGDIVLPTASAKVLFELTFGNEAPVTVLPDQVLERSSFFTGNVKVRAMLFGDENVSPIVGKDILLISGTMQANGVYISRSFTFGSGVRLDTVLSHKLPYNSGLTIQYDANDGNWQTVPFGSSVAIDRGFIEQQNTKTGITAPNGGRLKLTLTGDPSARPSVSDLRAWTS